MLNCDRRSPLADAMEMRTRKMKAWSSSSLRASFRPRPSLQSDVFKLRIKGRSFAVAAPMSARKFAKS